MTGNITPKHIAVRHGDNFTIQLQFKNHCNKDFIDLTGAVLKMQVRLKNSNKSVLIKNGSIDDAAKGKAHISLLPSDTRSLNVAEEYITDIQITFGNGEVHTIYPADFAGVADFVIIPDVTE